MVAHGFRCSPSAIAAGATTVMFMQIDTDAIVGVFLTALGSPYTLDSTTAYAAAVRRVDVNTYDAVSPYNVRAPGVRVTPDQAQTIDGALCDMLARLNLRFL